MRYHSRDLLWDLIGFGIGCAVAVVVLGIRETPKDWAVFPVSFLLFGAIGASFASIVRNRFRLK